MKNEHHPHGGSQLEQQALCSGSYKMQIGLPEDDNEDRKEGILLHKAVEINRVEGLNTEQTLTVQKCLKKMEEIAPWDEWQKEVRVQLMDEDFDEINFGTVDALIVLEDRVVAWDWKMGRREVPSPKDNMQCKSYVASLMQEYELPVEFGIGQPRMNKFQQHRFEVNSIEPILNSIQSIIVNCNEATFILNPGEYQCAYCKAKTTCPARLATLNESPLAKIESTSEIESPEKLGEYLANWKNIQKVGKSLENRARQMLMDNIEVPGWCLKSKAGSRTVEDSQRFYESIAEYVPLDEFLKSVTVKIGDVEDKYCRNKKKKDKSTLKNNKEEFGTRVSPYVVQKNKTFTLTKLNKGK